MLKICKNCTFYDLGVCKRYPPIIFKENYRYIYKTPELEEYNWCGEFKNKGDG